MKAFLNKHIAKIFIPLLALNFFLPLSGIWMGDHVPVTVLKTIMQVFNITFILQLAVAVSLPVLLIFTNVIYEKRIKRLCWIFIIITALEAVPVIANMTL